MIMDVTGVELTPGKGGVDCLGNGRHVGADGAPIPCCCDECDYLMCCCGMCDCAECDDEECPRTQN